MEDISNIGRFIADLYIGYINILIILFSLVGLNNPIFGIWIAQFPLYAIGFMRIWRIPYFSALFSFPTIIYNTIMSIFVLFVTDSWTKETPFVLTWFIITFWSLLSISGKERIRGRTIQRELDRYKKD